MLAACGGDKSADTPPADTAVKADTETSIVALGEQKYGQVCASCHMADGMGTPGAFPPLVNSEWLLGNPSVPIAIVLHGLQGPITVGGTQFEGAMQPWGMIPDRDIAAILTYARSAWGNSASAVTEAQVAEIRSSMPEHAAWTADELRAAFPNP